jgi:hypothetical protein
MVPVLQDVDRIEDLAGLRVALENLEDATPAQRRLLAWL